MNISWLSLFLFAAPAVQIIAAPLTFDFKDPKHAGTIAFKLIAPVETINGSPTNISGIITFDPENPGSTTGKIVIDTASMTVPNPLQTTHLRSDMWLNAKKFPEISFEAKELKNVKSDNAKTSADVTGNFSIHGVTNQITIPVEFKYLQGKLGEFSGGTQQGDLLVVNSTFTLHRKDFKINPGQMEDKVSDTITLTVGIVGKSPK